MRVANRPCSAWTRRVGTADDYDDSDGRAVLTFWEAQTLAKEVGRADGGGSTDRAAPLTVGSTAQAYLASLEARNCRTAYDARLRLNRMFLPSFAASRIEDLTRRELDLWRDGPVQSSDDAEQRRRSQDTANRVLSIVKALLNHAVGDPASGLKDDSAWPAGLARRTILRGLAALPTGLVYTPAAALASTPLVGRRSSSKPRS